jgi:hypothetical protein
MSGNPTAGVELAREAVQVRPGRVLHPSAAGVPGRNRAVSRRLGFPAEALTLCPSLQRTRRLDASGVKQGAAMTG